MYCRHCGTEIPEGTNTCPSCGKDTSPVRAASIPAADPKELVQKAATAAAPLPLAMIARIAVIAALLCFFLPFVMVSCNGDKSVSASYSGFEMITKIGADDDELLSQDSSKAKSNIFVFGAFACGVVSAVFMFVKKDKQKLAAALSAISAAALLVFRMTFRMYYGLNDSEYKKYIDVKTRFGLILCILFFLAAAAACLMETMNAQAPAAIPDTPAPLPDKPAEYPPAIPSPEIPPMPDTPPEPQTPPVPEAPPAPEVPPQDPETPSDPPTE